MAGRFFWLMAMPESAMRHYDMSDSAERKEIRKFLHPFCELYVNGENYKNDTTVPIHKYCCEMLSYCSSTWLIILIIVLVLVVLAGGAVAFWFFYWKRKRGDREVMVEESTESTESGTI